MWVAVVSLLLDRAAAGFPVLGEWFRRRKPDLVRLVEQHTSPGDVPDPVGAAPAEVKELAVSFLVRLRDRAGSYGLKFTLGLLIGLVPSLADEAWDAVAALLGGKEPVPPPVSAPGRETTARASIVADAFDADCAVRGAT